MRNFDYRAPRFSVDIPVQVVVADSVLAGRCTEISRGGARLEMRDSIPLDLDAILRISYRGLNLAIPARVIHRDARAMGMQFIGASEEQRHEVMRLIELLSTAAEECRVSTAALPQRCESSGALIVWSSQL